MPEKEWIEIVNQVEKYLEQQKTLSTDEIYLSDSEFALTGLRSHSRKTLCEMQQSISNCTRCALAKTRTNLVFGSGDVHANLMLIGEAPGQEEDMKGFPFVGKAGHLLEKILQAIDFTREEIYITNILKCRPPGNRDPLPEEIACCYPYLMRQIEIIQPQILLALGRIAAQTLLNTTTSLSTLRGQFHSVGNCDLFVTFHPAALLRNPNWKRPAWEDIQLLRKRYDTKVGDKPVWHPPKK